MNTSTVPTGEDRGVTIAELEGLSSAEIRQYLAGMEEQRIAARNAQQFQDAAVLRERIEYLESFAPLYIARAEVREAQAALATAEAQVETTQRDYSAATAACKDKEREREETVRQLDQELQAASFERDNKSSQLRATRTAVQRLQANLSEKVFIVEALEAGKTPEQLRAEIDEAAAQQQEAERRQQIRDQRREGLEQEEAYRQSFREARDIRRL